MSRPARDPAESAAQFFALIITAGCALLIAIIKIVPPGAAVHGLVQQVQLSVIAPPKDQPAPQPKQPPKRVPVTERHVVRAAISVRRSEPLPTPTPEPVVAAPDVPTVEMPAASAPAAGPVDPNLAYEAQVLANIAARNCAPNTPEYRLTRPAGTSRVRFAIDRAGEASDVRIAASSGSTILDRQANAIVSSGSYPRMPAEVFPGETRHVLVVDVEFRPGGGCAS